MEDLTELLESPIEAENIPVLRQKMTDKTVITLFHDVLHYANVSSLQVYVQKRNEIMLEDTAKGFQDNRWRWNVDVDGFEPATMIAD